MKVALTACSDGQLKDWESQNIELQNILSEMGIETVFADHIYAITDSYSGTDRRPDALFPR